MPLRDCRPLLACAVAAWLALDVSSAQGQEVAGSFAQLRSVVAVGDTVIVDDVQGHEVHGIVAELSDSSLALRVDKDRVVLLEEDVDTVSRRDSRWNGTLWGLGAGAIVGTAMDHGLVEEYGREDIQVGESVAFIAGAAALGAGVGFVVDALIKGRRVIYARRHAMPEKAGLSPILGASRRGVAVSLWF